MSLNQLKRRRELGDMRCVATLGCSSWETKVTLLLGMAA
jgi:hypothetical protein